MQGRDDSGAKPRSNRRQSTRADRQRARKLKQVRRRIGEFAARAARVDREARQ